MLVQGLVCSVEPSIFFLTNQTFRPLLLRDHRCPKVCFNSNLHVVILANKKKGRKLEESYFLGKSPESAHVIFMDISGQNLVMWTQSAPRYLGILLYSFHPYVCLKFSEYNTAKEEGTIFFFFDVHNINKLAQVYQ